MEGPGLRGRGAVRLPLTTAPPTVLGQAEGLWGAGQDQGQLLVGFPRPVGPGDHPESGQKQPARVVNGTTEGKSPRTSISKPVRCAGYEAAA